VPVRVRTVGFSGLKRPLMGQAIYSQIQNDGREGGDLQQRVMGKIFNRLDQFLRIHSKMEIGLSPGVSHSDLNAK